MQALERTLALGSYDAGSSLEAVIVVPTSEDSHELKICGMWVVACHATDASESEC